jgi:cobalt-zinc-cadmium efflux system protein
MTALSHITENRKVWTRKSLIFQYTIFGFCLEKGLLRQSLAIFITVEAVRRLQAPPDVHGGWMMVIAIGGLFINLLGLVLLGKNTSESLNIRGAWLHMLSDTLGSIGAMLAGALIGAWQWHWVDPVISVLISGLVLFSSWALLKETVAVLMEGTPGHIDVDKVHQAIRALPGVHSVNWLRVLQFALTSYNI